MKRAILLGALAVFLASPILAQEEAGKPDLSIPRTRHDFGKVFERDKYEYKFKVVNRGSAELQITDVKPT